MDFSSSQEWSVDDWTKEWTIHVGKAYRCSICGTMAMVTKGGVGVMEPKCCGRAMALVEKPDDIR
ncbi:MAG: hypothetical protein HY026_01785 [Deltaproteobacteria bacterium]|nr:hypothetical protein [Deltaproteobacteria bacterium]